MSEITNIEFEHIRLDGGTQTREQLNESSVLEYTEAFRNGAAFPPVTVFFDGSSFWLADGFHRYSACKDAGFESILANVINGTKRDAVLFSKGANADHGFPRSNAVKRQVVADMLNDEEWAKWSDREISRACCVSARLVAEVRNSICGNKQIENNQEPVSVTRTVERNGKTYEQNTSNIGKTAAIPKPVKEVAPVVVVSVVDGNAYDPSKEEPNLVQIAEELQAENEALQRENKSLKTDDKDAELSRLNLLCDQLDGHRKGETNTKNEAQKQAKYYGDLLAKIRKVLNVDSNSKILAALEAR